MSPEQERVLYEVHAHVVEMKTTVTADRARLAEHEVEDVAAHASAHARIGKVEKTLVKLLAAYGAACVIVPVALWLLEHK